MDQDARHLSGSDGGATQSFAWTLGLERHVRLRIQRGQLVSARRSRLLSTGGDKHRSAATTVHGRGQFATMELAEYTSVQMGSANPGWREGAMQNPAAYPSDGAPDVRP
jgi:hypothetical protein